MAMGKRREKQRPLWIGTERLAQSTGHPFYEQLAKFLREEGFDTFVEELCRNFYSEPKGRPSMPPTVYFRMVLIGDFKGIESDRGIAWRVADSITLREFLGYELSEATPDPSTLSRTRRLVDTETHEAVFDGVIQLLARKGLVRGKTLGIDGTTLEASAAMRSIVRRDTAEGYREYVARLAHEEGLENPSAGDLVRFDKKRKKKISNKEWRHPHDPDAKVTKMKDGRTHLAHKAEHAVDLETEAILAVTLQPADRGDTKSLSVTLEEVGKGLESVIEDAEAASRMSHELMAELVADKGYHSNAVLRTQAEAGIRTYIAEPKLGRRRRWKGKAKEKAAVYANRRRIRGRRGSLWGRARSQKVERPFAHCYETGGMRRTTLRGHEKILKCLLVHVAGFNLGLVLRQRFGVGTPRGLQGLRLALFDRFPLLYRLVCWFLRLLPSTNCHIASWGRKMYSPAGAVAQV